MLDLSINDFFKEINTDRKLHDVLEDGLSYYQEKIDGTKLTLLRNNEEYNPLDYAKNWIVSYKDNIIFSTEFDSLKSRNDEIETESIGTSQYKFIHDHLRTIHENCSNIPKNTEFFIEFAQRKPTLTRIYSRYHEMFLIGYDTNVEYYISNGILTTVGNLSNDYLEMNYFRKKLNLLSFPQSKFQKNDLKKISNLLDAKLLFNKLLQQPSILGGKIEGIVLKTLSGKYYKVLQDDQHDKNVRLQNKIQYIMTPEREDSYWKIINEKANELVHNIPQEKTSIYNIMSLLSAECYSNNISILHDRKAKINVQDDLFLTSKLRYFKEKEISNNIKTVGLYPISGKPVHLGHWKMILKASRENEKVIVFVSLKDRIKKNEFPILGKDMFIIWKNILINYLPENVIIKFDNSPVNAVYHEISYLEKNKSNIIINIYSDDNDINTFNKKSNSIFLNGIDRHLTTNISGREMRKLISLGFKEIFMKFLPQIKIEDKEKIWIILQKN